MGLEFPDVYATSYVAQSLPRIKAKDINALQREQIRTWRALRGNDLLVGDEFTGDTLNRGIWVNQANNPTIENDAANGAAGVAKFDPSAATPRRLRSRPLIVGTNEFRVSARVKATLTGSVTVATPPIILCGLFQDSDSSTGLGMWIGGNGPNLTIGDRDRWSAYVSNGDGTGDFDLDAGAGIANDGLYHTIELFRTSKAIQFLYDGGLVYESTNATWLAKNFTKDMSLCLDCGGTGTDYYVARLDAIKLWVARSPLTEAIGGSAPAQHYEEQTFPFAAAGGVVVAWSTPFADTSYKVKLGLLRTDSGTPVTYCITAKTTTTCTVTFGFAITGELYIEAHD